MIYEFQATQSFNGYDKPWAGGANVNQWDPSDAVAGYIDKTDGTLTPAQSPTLLEYSSDYIEIPDGTTNITVGFGYYLPSEQVWMSIALYDDNKDFIARPARNQQSGLTKAYFTISAADYTTAKYIRVSSRTYGHSLDYLYLAFSNIKKYTPYANICMPEGFNMWDPEAQDYVQVYAGFVNANTRELYLRPVYPEYAGEELVGPWMSSLELYDEDTTPTEGAFVIDFGGELESFEITPFMLQTLLDSLGIRQHFTNGAGLLNSLMDQAQGRVRSEEELLHLSRPLNVIAIGDQLPAGITFKPISKDVLPGLPGKFIR